MSNMHRIHWFDQQIRDGRYPNSRLLAEEFEISTRQAQRDIEYLEISLRAPLAYIAQKRGYCYEDKTFLLPLLYMTEEEKRVLNYLAHRYRSYDYENSSSVRRVAHLLGRFTDEQLESTRLPIFNVSPQVLQFFELLTHAVRESLIVQILYRGEEGEIFIIGCPLQLLSKYSADYVLIHCTERHKDIELRLERIKHLKVTEDKVEMNTPNYLYGNADALHPRSKPFQAQIVFRQPMACNTWYGYPAHEIVDCTYRIEFYDAELFMQDLMIHMTEWQKLSSPKWLRTRLRSRCETIVGQLDLSNAYSTDTLKE